MSSPVTNRELVIFGIAVVAVAVAVGQFINARSPYGMGVHGWQPRMGFHDGWRGAMDGHGPGGFGMMRGDGPRGPGGFLMRADVNRDGTITKDELVAGANAHIDELFEVMDTDKDGKLSKEELAKGRELMRERMRAKWAAERTAPDAAPAVSK